MGDADGASVGALEGEDDGVVVGLKVGALMPGQVLPPFVEIKDCI